MTKRTPTEIIAEQRVHGVQVAYRAEHFITALAKAGYAIVPIKPSEEMLEGLARIGDGPMISGGEVWGYMLAAAKAHSDPSNSIKPV